MALKAGRVGLATELVDEFGYLKGDAPSGEYYTKTQTDNKFETKTHVNNNFQKKTLEVPIELLQGSALTVESALQGLNEEKQNIQLSVPIDMLSGSKLTVESALNGLNEEKFDRAEQRVLGARNRFYLGNKVSGAQLSTINADGSSIRIKNEIAATYQATHFLVPVEKNTNYKFVSSVDYTSGVGKIQIRESDDSADIVKTDNITTDGSVELSFNSGNRTSVRVKLFCTMDTSAVGDVAYNNSMLLLTPDTDNTYVPYAMTNREITEEFVVQESEVTDVVSGATASVNRLVKYGKIVQCFVTLNDVTLSSGDVLFKVPNEYRPIQTFRSVAFNTSSNVIEKNISISSGGDVVILGSVSNVNIMVDATWITP